MKIQPDKCDFLRKEAAYLEHNVTKDSVNSNPAKISALHGFPQPKNQKQIKQLLDLTGYYRRFTTIQKL